MKRVVPNKVDRDRLHEYLWRNSNSRGRVTVKHADFAEDLGIRADHLGRILREMVAAKRMTQIATSHDGVTYGVVDPSKWLLQQRQPKRRKLR